MKWIVYSQNESFFNANFITAIGTKIKILTLYLRLCISLVILYDREDFVVILPDRDKIGEGNVILVLLLQPL